VARTGGGWVGWFGGRGFGGRGMGVGCWVHVGCGVGGLGFTAVHLDGGQGVKAFDLEFLDGSGVSGGRRLHHKWFGAFWGSVLSG
jgi:hypothetical protein